MSSWPAFASSAHRASTDTGSSRLLPVGDLRHAHHLEAVAAVVTRLVKQAALRRARVSDEQESFELWDTAAAPPITGL
ncbi:hypothetical protein [Saccharothrix variisporea]|uniref:Uncharacterized protein n=1 Tax=Saccharothrix variisporea TaxID=543527 RepID=A0A495X0V5_9PSEU|nr:hypothetical protein [Saccharothrix variisporea]RKT66844.1 hypothetical protein DFJ66_0008 [Saccharothrix variisporea]